MCLLNTGRETAVVYAGTVIVTVENAVELQGLVTVVINEKKKKSSGKKGRKGACNVGTSKSQVRAYS